jgi:UDP-N-acetylmuramyl pentapeptide phosphotransferase/UDP-N-acetylglucosamine-1-phosphate transferase
VHTNVDGQPVPAVLGWAIAAGVGAASLLTAVWLHFDHREVGSVAPAGGEMDLLLVRIPWEFAWAPVVTVGGMFVAGLWDDLRGDERPRGFRGHLGALRGGAVTGGMVKLVAGGVVGMLALWVLEREVSFAPRVLLGAATIALSANLINLFDRAPGRALKISLLIATPLLLLDADWRLLAAGTIGSAVVLLPVDLRARGMLGDAGANPLGAMLGLGLVLSAGGRTWILAAIMVVLLALNLASERWSYSAIIASTPWLARLDHLGRK